ncbi:hypothetical protein R3P38DRAFT_2900377 [Favolaschia claudopus]|uniref:Uncharacterized protein n=1 Tax=Favolaschia claudopus TaxID=2862362 RepID=A0AAW0CMR1_9AGAR
MSYSVQDLPASSPPLSPRAPRPSAVSTRHTTYKLFNGGALDSQVSDSQYINNLTGQIPSSPTRPETSFTSSASSDTAYDLDDEALPWLSAHSQGDEHPQFAHLLKKPSTVHDDEPMETAEALGFPDSRPVTPTFNFLALYADLKAEDVHLSPSEVRVIAAIRADKDAVVDEYARREMEWSCDMAERHNLVARVAVLESLLEYHRIPLPE